MSDESSIDEPVLNVTQAAQRLGVHPNTVRNWANEGRLLPAYRLAGSGFRRFRVGDVERLRREMRAMYAADTLTGWIVCDSAGRLIARSDSGYWGRADAEDWIRRNRPADDD